MCKVRVFRFCMFSPLLTRYPGVFSGADTCSAVTSRIASVINALNSIRHTYSAASIVGPVLRIMGAVACAVDDKVESHGLIEKTMRTGSAVNSGW